MSSRPVALITGASRGIGRGIALALAREGFDIAGNATSYDPTRQDSGLAETEQRVRELGANFIAAPGDLACLDIHEDILAAVLHRFRRIDVLVNNAGVAPLQRVDVLETTPESYDRVLGINTRGPFFLTQRVARQMIGQPRGARTPTIVFITSISAVVSSPTRAEYCISKAALSQAAAVYADRLAETGINVYEVRPGIIATDMTAPVQEKYDASIANGLVPQRRWGLPEDVGRAVAALVRGDFGYATGLAIELSGGMNIRHL